MASHYSKAASGRCRGREHPTSKCLAVSLKLLKRQSPGLRLVVSYADTKEGHLGTIYQATNWLFLEAANQPYLKVRGKIEHPRSLYDRFCPGGQSLDWLRAKLQAKLLGQIQETTTVNVAILPEWAGLRQAMLNALRPFPEARAAMIEALRDLGY